MISTTFPPARNNPVGVLWAGLNRPGIGIHGSPVPDTIGRAGSHGCIRLSNWDAATFYTLVREREGHRRHHPLKPSAMIRATSSTGLGAARSQDGVGAAPRSHTWQGSLGTGHQIREHWLNERPKADRR
ncbi:L,D-transpeptidase [Luteolibacter algae]|uniref:L,D-transpeptidase n=1 Tax=Luteolibacter algae TaxID=454151 RepID=A0ABW5DC63_9BACT